MLKITVRNERKPPTVMLDGKLTGDWVHELERVWENLAANRPASEITLDLSGVTFVDMEGRRLLGSMMEHGARLQDPQLWVKYIVEAIKAGRTTQCNTGETP